MLKIGQSESVIFSVKVLEELLYCSDLTMYYIPHSSRVKGLVPKYIQSGMKTIGESTPASATSVASNAAGRVPQVSIILANKYCSII